MAKAAQKGKHLAGGWLTVAEAGSTIIMAGNMVAGRQGAGVAERLLLILKLEGGERGILGLT